MSTVGKLFDFAGKYHSQLEGEGREGKKPAIEEK